jgi:hypothetical protein
MGRCHLALFDLAYSFVLNDGSVQLVGKLMICEQTVS